MSTPPSTEKEKALAEHIEDSGSIEKPDHTNGGIDLHVLAEAAAEEKNLTVAQALWKYRAACGYAFFLSLGACMSGFDSSISSGVIAIPSFRNDMGSLIGGQQVVSAAWQSGWSGAARIGQLSGGLSAGSIADKIGRKGTVLIGAIISIGSIFIQFFLKPQQPVQLLFGRTINAWSMGLFGAMASNYAAEVSPTALRGITTGGVNFWVVLGQFLATVVVYAQGQRTDSFAYRVPYAIQWIFPVILALGLFFIPESPWYLVRKGKHDKALRSLEQVLRGSGADPKLHLRQIQETIELEAQHKEEGRWIDLFKGTNRRRTFIASMVFVCQEMAGVQFVLGYSTYFFELAGFATANAFKLGIGTLALAMVGNFIGLATIEHLGRRTLFFWGMIACTVDCLLLGICSVVPGQGALWGQAAFTMIYMLAYQSGIGPVGYCVYAEISSAQLRSKTIAWGVMVNQVFAGVVQVINPYLINPNEANLEGKVGWIFGGIGVFGTIYTWFFIPETKGRTVDEIDELFERRISARDFGKAKIGEDRTVHIDEKAV
ncbi:maltose permease [Calocera viscosa TUFC12733]|uniref:Maltose permease n=1 Tax=Calocera viscosa (strain TUFC12733) TaxID=1330018 RepID=A0A167P2F6_CALVF|nr:maltose permease [Calocera viscosa TUFC12733]